MAGLYFEEFEVGREFHHEFSRTVTEMDNTMFSLLTMNPQPLHLDAHFSENTEFGQRLFNSLYTLAIMIGMSVYDTTLGTTIGNLGMTDVKFPKPVFHGDTLKAHTKIISKRISKSRPTQGIVEFEHTATNQRGDSVCIPCTNQVLELSVVPCSNRSCVNSPASFVCAIAYSPSTVHISRRLSARSACCAGVAVA